MAKPNYAYEKRQRDLEKRSKQEEKRLRKLERKQGEDDQAPAESENSREPGMDVPGADT